MGYSGELIPRKEKVRSTRKNSCDILDINNHCGGTLDHVTLTMGRPGRKKSQIVT